MNRLTVAVVGAVCFAVGGLAGGILGAMKTPGLAQAIAERDAARAELVEVGVARAAEALAAQEAAEKTPERELEGRLIVAEARAAEAEKRLTEFRAKVESLGPFLAGASAGVPQGKKLGIVEVAKWTRWKIASGADPKAVVSRLIEEAKSPGRLALEFRSDSAYEEDLRSNP
jgi:hypothetical protein